MHKLKYGSLTTLKYLTLIIGVFGALAPLVVVLFASFKDTMEYHNTSALTPPMHWLNFDNYVTAFTKGQMLTGFKNTLIIMVVAILGNIFIGTMIAYVLQRFRFRGRGAIMAAFLFAALIPGVTTQVITFQIVHWLGLFNSMGAAIVLYMGTDIIGIYVFIQFMDNISSQLDESAMIDGASYFTIFTKIIFPLLTPAIVTMTIIKGIGIYNDFYIPFLYMPDPSLRTISTSLFAFKGPFGSHWETICAAVMIIIAPTAILFVALQKYIYSGFTQGAVK
ncbi:carbohydrate ABC transporter permease [Paenibacillus hexagrammi]|uniref:Carbohydrate ABC transporter permease n=1 Tax=Paenibacillus hexagrammi TaxID=2908839 RepID=A0ABY3SEM8_9BACL|nr:carbohydrate ABC transporter permease [Paenibacillus sp. YPD9-1]UJF31377.1 carbohydrate ABC transporter permease [Paenibacillus sp. YPD9-1]